MTENEDQSYWVKYAVPAVNKNSWFKFFEDCDLLHCCHLIISRKKISKSRLLIIFYLTVNFQLSYSYWSICSNEYWLFITFELHLLLLLSFKNYPSNSAWNSRLHLGPDPRRRLKGEGHDETRTLWIRAVSTVKSRVLTCVSN